MYMALVDGGQEVGVGRAVIVNRVVVMELEVQAC